MTKRPYFDGEPDRFTRTKALFPEQDTRRVKWATPIDRKFRLSRLQAMADRILQRRTA